MVITLVWLPALALAQQPQLGQGHGHHEFPADVARFHAVMAPLWHAADGEERAARTCDQAAQLGDRAAAIQAAPVPEVVGDHAGWVDASERLADRVQALNTACRAPVHAGFREALVQVHDAFHDLVRLVGHQH
ncbi:MAG: hypothetical protein OEQ18_11410 [Gammaproteobacteria bacterium]|nr:hypothetical protein [Gammaproteobacteria bacterium]